MGNTNSHYEEVYQAGKYSLSEYDGLETDFRILEAIEVLTNNDIMDSDGGARAAWLGSESEPDVVAYILRVYPLSVGEKLRWGEEVINVRPPVDRPAA